MKPGTERPRRRRLTSGGDRTSYRMKSGTERRIEGENSVRLSRAGYVRRLPGAIIVGRHRLVLVRLRQLVRLRGGRIVSRLTVVVPRLHHYFVVRPAVLLGGRVDVEVA